MLDSSQISFQYQATRQTESTPGFPQFKPQLQQPQASEQLAFQASSTEYRQAAYQPAQSHRSIFASNPMEGSYPFTTAGLFYAPIDGEASAVDRAVWGTAQ